MDVSRMLTLMKQKGIRQSFIEKSIGGYRGKITDWKNGKSSPSDRELEMIADLLLTSSAYLRGDTCDPSQNQDGAPSPEQIRERERALKYLGVIKDDGSIDHDLVEVAKVFLKSYQDVSGK